MAEDYCDRFPEEVERAPAASAMLPSMIRRYSAARKKMTRAQKLKNRCAPVRTPRVRPPRGVDARSDTKKRVTRISRLSNRSPRRP